MSFMIGCGSTSKKYLEVKSFDEETTFRGIDFEKAITNDTLIIKTPPLLVEQEQEGILIGVMEISLISEQVFFIEFYSKARGDRYGRCVFKYNIGGSGRLMQYVAKPDSYDYPNPAFTSNIKQFDIGISIEPMPSLGNNSGGIKLTLPYGFIQQYADTIIRFGKTRIMRARNIYVDLRQDSYSDVTFSYSKEDLIQLCGDSTSYEFQLPYTLLKDGNGLVFGEGVLYYNRRILYGDNPKAISLLPTIDSTKHTAKYLCPSGMTMLEASSRKAVPAGTELSPTKSYDMSKRVPNGDTLTINYVYTGSGITKVFMQFSSPLSKWIGKDITFVFVKRVV